MFLLVGSGLYTSKWHFEKDKLKQRKANLRLEFKDGQHRCFIRQGGCPSFYYVFMSSRQRTFIVTACAERDSRND